MVDRASSLRGEEFDISRQLEAAEKRFDKAKTGTAAKERAKIEMTTLRNALDSIKETTAQVQTDIKIQSRELAENIKDIMEESGLKVGVRGAIRGLNITEDAEDMSIEELSERIESVLKEGDGEVIKELEQLNVRQSLLLKLSIAKVIKEKYGKIANYLSGTDFQLVKMFLGKGLLVFSGLMLGMTALVALIFILYQAGLLDFFETTKEILKGLWGTVSESFMLFLEGIVNLTTGIFDIITGLFAFFQALFSGDGEGLRVAFQKVMGGVLKVIGGLVQILIGAAGTIFFTGVSMIGTIIVGAIQMLLNAAVSLTGATNVKGMFAGASVGGIAGGLIGLAVSGGNPLGMKVGAAIGGYAGGYIGGRMETGGVTPSSGGMFLVGERGPEIVSLPGNTRVYNNTDTKNMMSPTININVTGRVGASDTELNDIARKIGQKINIEMNRYNSSGLRG